MKRLLILPAAAAALVLCAPAANADQYDFINRLDASGVSYTGYMSDMIDLGKVVCHELRMQTPVPAIVGYLKSRNFPDHDAGTIVGAAAATMCPDTWPFIDSYLNGPPPAQPAPPAPNPCTLENPPVGCADGDY
jgi:hypothetical protein